MTVHYSLIQFFFWFTYGASVNFAGVYLLANGASNTAYGIVSAAACALSIFIQPAVCSYADKEKSLSVKTLILMLSSAMIVCFAVLTAVFGRGTLLNCVIIAVPILIVQVLFPLMNSLATETINAGKCLNFSLARGIGSIGYAVMSFTLGKVIALFGARVHPWVLTGVAAVLLILTALFPFEKRKLSEEYAGSVRETGSVTKPRTAGKVSAGASEKPLTTAGNTSAAGAALHLQTGGSFFRRYPVFSAALIGCSLIYTSHVYINNFVFQIAVAKGGGSEHMGIAMGIAGILEILSMLVFPFLLKKKGAGFWMCFSGIFFTLKCLGTLLAPSIPALYAVQIFQPPGWGLMTVASVYYVNSIMAERDRIKGQAYMTMTLSVGTIIGALTGGVLIDQIGVNGMLAVSVIAGAAGTLVTMLTIGRSVKR